MAVVDEAGKIRDIALATLRPALEGFAECALLDFASIPNTGDSMLYCGAKRLLSECGVRVVYEADRITMQPEVLRRRIGLGGLIVMHGGGNIVDAWEPLLRFRIDVLREFGDRTIVQLPQSISLKESGNREAFSSAASSHPSYRLFVRDGESAARAREMGLNPTLCPDVALMLHPLRVRRPERLRPMCVFREDAEAAGARGRIERRYFSPLWVRGRTLGYGCMFALKGVCHALKWCGLRPLAAVAGDVAAAYAGMYAERQTARAASWIAGSSVVATDRLHVAVMAFLLRVPHVVVDNSYGKISSFFHTWLPNSSITTFVPDRDSALASVEAF